MSSEESLSEPESGRHDGNSSGLDEDLPNRKRICVRPLLWQSTEANGLMAWLDRKITRRQSQQSASMVIERTVGPASNWEATDDAPKFALAPTT